MLSPGKQPTESNTNVYLEITAIIVLLDFAVLSYDDCC